MIKIKLAFFFFAAVIISCANTGIDLMPTEINQYTEILVTGYDNGQKSGTGVIAELAKIPVQTPYVLLIFPGQSNMGRSCFGSYVPCEAWDTNKFKMVPTKYNCSNIRGLVMGYDYYLIPKLQAKYPGVRFVAIHFNIRATALTDAQVGGWNPTTPYNLFYNLADHVRDAIVANGIPTSINMFWTQGENDDGVDSTLYLKKEKLLFDSLPQYSGTSKSIWKYYNYLPKKQGSPNFCHGPVWAKKQHAAQDSSVVCWGIDIANYVTGDVHMTTPPLTGLNVASDTLMKVIGRRGL